MAEMGNNSSQNQRSFDQIIIFLERKSGTLQEEEVGGRNGMEGSRKEHNNKFKSDRT
jgi:hypothetical protein